MTLAELLESCEAEALLGKLESTEETVWRYICRQYSIKFHTPLHVVMNDLDPREVILAHYEGQLEDVDTEENIEKLLDSVYTLQDPEYAQQKRDDLANDIKQYEAEEAARIKAGRPIHKAMANDDSPLGPDLPKKTSNVATEETRPTHGSINLSYLEDDESNGGGFRE